MKLNDAPAACSVDAIAVDSATHSTTDGASPRDIATRGCPHLPSHLARVSERPRVQQSLRVGGRVK